MNPINSIYKEGFPARGSNPSHIPKHAIHGAFVVLGCLPRLFLQTMVHISELSWFPISLSNKKRLLTVAVGDLQSEVLPTAIPVSDKWILLSTFLVMGSALSKLTPIFLATEINADCWTERIEGFYLCPLVLPGWRSSWAFGLFAWWASACPPPCYWFW